MHTHMPEKSQIFSIQVKNLYFILEKDKTK